MSRRGQIIYVFFVVFLFFAISYLALSPGKKIVLSYDTNVAHPNISELAANLYNEKFNNKLTKEEINWMKQGAINEDTPTRWMNHFYDPIHDIGLKNLYLSSKDWAVNPNAQKNYSLGDNSWPRAISDYQKGDKQEALKELGHVLHLLADAAVPAHTRDDVHVLGDSYEQFVKNNWNNISKDLHYFFVNVNKLSSAFDALANYSNNNFYSDHTIESSDYHIITPLEYQTTTLNNFAPLLTVLVKAADPNGNKYNLYSLPTTDWKLNLNYKYVSNSEVLTDYAKLLIPKAIGYSAGVIKLFFDEVKKVQVETELPLERVSSLGKIDKIIGSAVQGAENVYYSAKESFITPPPNITPELVPTSPQVSLPEILSPTIPLSVILQITSSPILPSPAISPPPSFVYSIGLPAVPDEPLPFSITIPEPIPTSTPTTTPTPSTTPDPDPITSSTPDLSMEVVINEIAWAGTSADYPNDEWFELYNNTDEDVDLSNWQILVDSKPISVSKINNKIISAHGYYLLERTSDSVINDIIADQIYSVSGGFKNGGAKIELINPYNETIDQVDASSTWFAGDTIKYRTMERVDVLRSGNEPDNWQASLGSRITGKGRYGNQIYGSPKQPNFGYIALNYAQEDSVRTLTARDNPYLLEYYTIPAGMTLKIEPGVIIKSYFRDAKIDVYGDVEAGGTNDNKIIITTSSQQGVTTWQGILFHSGSTGKIVNVDFSYGDRAIESENSSLELSDCTFSNFSNINGPLIIKNRWPSLNNLSFHDNIINLPYLTDIVITEPLVEEKKQDVLINAINISASSTLKIWPGSNLYLTHYAVMFVYGSLIAEGTSENPIRILPVTSTLKWGNIRFFNSSSSFDYVDIRYGNLLPSNPKELDGMLIANNSNLKFNHALIWDSRPPGNTILANDSVLNMANTQIGNTEKYPDNGVPGITTTGIKSNRGVITLDNVKFKNLLVGIDGGSPNNGLPVLQMQNISTSSFDNVSYRCQPTTLCSF